jgi:hypothetical protein
MKRLLVLVAALLVVTGAFAQNVPETNNHKFRPRGWAKPGGGGATNLTYHAPGPVIQVAHVVFIFWGPTFNDPASPDHLYATTLENFRNNYGMTGEYNVITQYYQNLGSGNQFIQLSNLALGTGDWFDISNPPTNVTDADVQAEVSRYLASHAFDNSSVYEVLIPASSYSSDGTSTSCGGPNLAYCAYHGHFISGVNDVKYAIGPYPSCGGCQSVGFSDVQNAEHFICHETREAVSDPDLNAWFDRRGNEADDKCAWSPAPFIDPATGFAYQYEWSNAASGCVQTR